MLPPARDRCTTCERAIERNAVLAHRLRKTIAIVHQQHRGASDPYEWSACRHPDCQAAWQALEGDAPQPLAARRTA